MTSTFSSHFTLVPSLKGSFTTIEKKKRYSLIFYAQIHSMGMLKLLK